jgi:hypothetical protein
MEEIIMASVDALELVSQEEGLIKSTPTEETMKRITKMRVASVKASNNSKISRMTRDALVYTVKYLRNRHYLSDDQIKELSSEDLNRIPGLIFADRGTRVLSFGWIPLFGWIFAGKYILFKSRVKFLRSLDENIFDKANIEQAINCSYPAPDF